MLPQTEMAVSEGSTLTLGSNHPLITPDDSVPPASQASTLTSQGRELTPATISEPSMAQSMEESKLPPTRHSVTTKSTQTNTCCMGY